MWLLSICLIPRSHVNFSLESTASKCAPVTQSSLFSTITGLAIKPLSMSCNQARKVELALFQTIGWFSKRTGRSLHSDSRNENTQIWPNWSRIQSIPRTLTSSFDVLVLMVNQPNIDFVLISIPACALGWLHNFSPYAALFPGRVFASLKMFFSCYKYDLRWRQIEWKLLSVPAE